MLCLGRDDDGYNELLIPAIRSGSFVSIILPANIYLIGEVGHGNW